MREKYSKRAFDGLIKEWRHRLHKHWAPVTVADDENDEYPDDDDSDDMCKEVKVDTQPAPLLAQAAEDEFWAQIRSPQPPTE